MPAACCTYLSLFYCFVLESRTLRQRSAEQLVLAQIGVSVQGTKNVSVQSTKNISVQGTKNISVLGTKRWC